MPSEEITVDSENIGGEFDKNVPLLRSSPFYKRFMTIANNCQSIKRPPGYVQNKLFNSEFLKLLLEKYLPLCPLWSAIMLGESYSISNSLVENFFSQLKNNKLRGEKNLKCSHFIRKLREDVLSLKVESDA